MGEEVNKLGMRMKKTRAMWQWRQPGNYAKPLQASRSSLAMAFGRKWKQLFFGPCTHSFSALIRYFLIPLLLQWKTVTVLLTTGSLPEVTLLAPALTQHPMPLDTVQSIYLNIFFLYEKGGVPYFAYFIKYFQMYIL